MGRRQQTRQARFTVLPILLLLNIITKELTIVKVSIKAVFGHQLVVVPGLNDVPVVYHHNLFGVANGRQPMGTHKARPVLLQIIHRRLDQCFRPGIDRTGGLIQNQDFGVCKECSGNCQQLPLAL